MRRGSPGPAPAVAGGWRLAALGLARGPWPHYKAGKITLISVTPPRPPPTPWALNDLCPARVARLLSLSMLRTMQAAGPSRFFWRCRNAYAGLATTLDGVATHSHYVHYVRGVSAQNLEFEGPAGPR
jgi:hypothetical protein